MNILMPLLRVVPAVMTNRRIVCQIVISFPNWISLPLTYNANISMNIDMAKWSGVRVGTIT